jgi:hypothetical protein
MKSSETSTDSPQKYRDSMETPSARQVRLASYAMERGHVKTPRRHLAEGLDPNAFFHQRSSGPGPWTLIETAARRGYFECFKALEDTGARISDDAILSAIEDDIDRSVLAHLLATGTFEPRGLRQDGWTWIDYVNRIRSPHAALGMAWAIGELEQVELDSAIPGARTMRPRRFL